MTVLFPDPLDPTSATVCPTSTCRSRPVSTGTSALAGYLNTTSLNVIDGLKSSGLSPSSESELIGGS